MSTLWLPDSLRRRVVRAVLARHVGRDVSALRGLPAYAVFPLRRDGLDPVPELAAARERGPVTRLTTLLGTTIWLVTGYDEARAVLADATRFSNDMRPVLGTRTRSDAESIGGLGMTDDPDHGRLRGLLTPEFTKRRLARLQSDIDTIVADALDALPDLAEDGRSTWSRISGSPSRSGSSANCSAWPSPSALTSTRWGPPASTSPRAGSACSTRPPSPAPSSSMPSPVSAASLATG